MALPVSFAQALLSLREAQRRRQASNADLIDAQAAAALEAEGQAASQAGHSSWPDAVAAGAVVAEEVAEVCAAVVEGLTEKTVDAAPVAGEPMADSVEQPKAEEATSTVEQPKAEEPTTFAVDGTEAVVYGWRHGVPQSTVDSNLDSLKQRMGTWDHGAAHGHRGLVGAKACGGHITRPPLHWATPRRSNREHLWQWIPGAAKMGRSTCTTEESDSKDDSSEDEEVDSSEDEEVVNEDEEVVDENEDEEDQSAPKESCDLELQVHLDVASSSVRGRLDVASSSARGSQSVASTAAAASADYDEQAFEQARLAVTAALHDWQSHEDREQAFEQAFEQTRLDLTSPTSPADYDEDREEAFEQARLAVRKRRLTSPQRPPKRVP